MQSYDSILTNRDTSAIFPGNGTALFLKGPDGRNSITDLIHFEPIKYVWSLIFLATSSPFLIYALTCAVFYAPLLYGAYIAYNTKKCSLVIGALSFAYIFFPASFIQALADTRPFTLIYPAYVALTCAIFYNRTRFEKLAILTLFLSIREEALVMAIPFILFEYLRERFLNIKHTTSIQMLSVWCIWFIVAAGYFISIHEHYAFGSMQPSGTIGLIVTTARPFLITTVVGLFAVAAWYRKKLYAAFLQFFRKHPHYCSVALFGLLALPPVVSGFIAASPALWPPFFIFNRFSFTITLVVFAIVVALSSEAKSETLEQPRAWQLYVFTILIVLSVALQVVGPKSLITRVTTMLREKESAPLVFGAAQTIASQPVLVDTRTLQVFYDKSPRQVAVLFPEPTSYIVPNPEDYFPDNVTRLAAHINQPNAHIVIQKSSLPLVQEIAEYSGTTLTLIEENSIYAWYTTVPR
jgi:MFS family permease